MCCQRTLLLKASNILPHGKDTYSFTLSHIPIKVFGDIKIQMGYQVTSGQLVWLGWVGSTIWSSCIISLQAYAATFPQADVLLHASARRQRPLVVMNKSNALPLTNQVLSALPTASQTQQKPPINLPGTGYVFLDSMFLLRFSSVTYSSEGNLSLLRYALPSCAAGCESPGQAQP